MDRTILNLILLKIKKKKPKFPLFYRVLLILPPCMTSNIGSDVSINNIVQLGSADTKIGSQDAVKKVLDLKEK